MDKNPFWDFSLCHYAKAPVQALCLQLQEEAQANVNLVLFALWLAEEKRAFEYGVVEMYQPFQRWRQQVVLPLRQSRIAAKQQQGRTAIYEALKKCELEVERVEQDLLFDLLLKFPIVPADCGVGELAAQNLKAYLATLPLSQERQDTIACALIETILPAKHLN